MAAGVMAPLVCVCADECVCVQRSVCVCVQMCVCVCADECVCVCVCRCVCARARYTRTTLLFLNPQCHCENLKLKVVRNNASLELGFQSEVPFIFNSLSSGSELA